VARRPAVVGRLATVPELPEVEALVDVLRERAVGKVVTRVDVASIAVLKTSTHRSRPSAA